MKIEIIKQIRYHLNGFFPLLFRLLNRRKSEKKAHKQPLYGWFYHEICCLFLFLWASYSSNMHRVANGMNRTFS